MFSEQPIKVISKVIHLTKKNVKTLIVWAAYFSNSVNGKWQNSGGKSSKMFTLCKFLLGINSNAILPFLPQLGKALQLLRIFDRNSVRADDLLYTVQCTLYQK